MDASQSIENNTSIVEIIDRETLTNPLWEALRESVRRAIERIGEQHDRYDQQYTDCEMDGGMDFRRGGWICDAEHLAKHTKQLETTLLPTLRDQMNRLYSVMDPLEVTKDPFGRMNSILESLSGLQQALEQLHSSFPLLPDRTQLPPPSDNPNVLSERKLALIKYLYIIIKMHSVNRYTTDYLVQSCCRLNQNFHLSTMPLTGPAQDEQVFFYSYLEDNTTAVIDIIDELIYWFELPEFKVVHEAWEEAIIRISIPYLHPQVEITEKFRLIVQRVAPVIKLIRLFLKKLWRTATITGSFELDITLDTMQIQHMIATSLGLINDISSMGYTLKLARRKENPSDELLVEAKNITQSTQSLRYCINAYVLRAHINLQNNLPDPFLASRTQLRLWCKKWNSQFCIASKNLCDLIQQQSALATIEAQNRLQNATPTTT